MNDEIITELAWQMGRPIRYGGEFGGVLERASYMSSIAEEALAPIEIDSDQAIIRRIDRVPQGVVLVVAPWNYPFLTAINAIAPALIAGNTVVLKHAAQTLLAGERFEAAFRQAGAPKGVFTNVFLNHETTARLLESGAFDFVNFTGSVGGGQAVARAAAQSFTGTGLELGGKDPGYVADDADVEAAADTLIDAAMFNSGQCCCGIERIYVAQNKYDEFVERAVAIVESYKVGPPLDAETTHGPMAHARFASLVRDHVSKAIQQGARGLIDPSLFELDGAAYVAPQILGPVDIGDSNLV